MSSDEMNLHELEERALDLRILDLRIVEELERSPNLSSAIPSDFAARVAAKVPPQRPVAVASVTHYGRTFMWIGLVVLMIALVVLAVRGAASSPAGMAVEWTLCLQFLAFAVWMGVRSWRSN